MPASCRSGNCGMQFRHNSQRDMHEKMIHRGMFEQAADKMVKTIMQRSQPSDLKKKVFYVEGQGKVSYEEISRMDPQSEAYLHVQSTLVRFITDWLNNRPEHTVDDFFRIAQFSIVD